MTLYPTERTPRTCFQYHTNDGVKHRWGEEGTFYSFPRKLRKGMKIQMARDDDDVEVSLVG